MVLLQNGARLFGSRFHDLISAAGEWAVGEYSSCRVLLLEACPQCTQGTHALESSPLRKAGKSGLLDGYCCDLIGPLISRSWHVCTEWHPSPSGTMEEEELEEAIVNEWMERVHELPEQPLSVAEVRISHAL
eukprot:1147211-Pelagomonas_calceolata.AAC.7